MATSQSAVNRRWTDDDGQPQSLTEETSSKTGRRCNYWCVAGLLFLIGVVGVVVVLCLYLAFPGCSARLQYGLVMDAGSSHSELSLFRWKGEKLKGTGEVIQLTDCAVDGPGISTYGDRGDPEGAGKSFEACLNEAKRKVPDNRHGITPIYLGATAGMRILKQENSAMSDKVFASVEKAFKGSNFRITPNNVRMVADQEEGLYAWIAANLIKGTLGQSGSKVPTTGALDMGGASTQIAFETEEPKSPPKNDDDYITVRLYGYDFTIFTHSYLCFGQNEVFKRAKAQLVLNKPGDSRYDHPCLHNGNDEQIKVGDLFQKTCTVPTPVQSWQNDKILTFSGTGNVEGCRALIAQLLDVTNCKSKNYTYCFESDFIPETKGDFLALSSFFYAFSYINGKTAVAKTQAEYNTKVETYCKKPWSTVEAEGKAAKQKPEHISVYCFTGLFTLKLLGDVYKMNGSKWENINFVNKVDGVSMGWSLGFMTNATNTIPTEKVRGGIQTDLFIALLILFLVLIFIVLILSYRAWTHRRGRALGKDSDDNAIVSLCCVRSY